VWLDGRSPSLNIQRGTVRGIDPGKPYSTARNIIHYRYMARDR